MPEYRPHEIEAMRLAALYRQLDEIERREEAQMKRLEAQAVKQSLENRLRHEIKAFRETSARAAHRAR